MSKKTKGGYDVITRGGDESVYPQRREALAEEIADLVGPLAAKHDCDVVIVVQNHTGSSVLGHANTKWDVLKQALVDLQES